MDAVEMVICTAASSFKAEITFCWKSVNERAICTTDLAYLLLYSE